MEILLKRKADINANSEGCQLIHILAKMGNTKVVESLLDQKVDVNVTLKENPQHKPIHLAAINNQPEMVKTLLENKAENCANAAGLQPIHYAAKFGYTKVIESLLEQKENVNVPSSNDEKLTPIQVAINHGQWEGVKILLARKADLGFDQAGWHRIHFVAAHGAPKEIDLLLEHNTDINLASRTEHGNSPIHVAADSGKRDVLEFLLERKAVICANKAGWEPFHLSIARGHFSVFECLLERKADVNLPTNNNGRHKPIHIAAYNNRPEMTKTLLAYNAELDANAEGLHPIHIAVKAGYTQVVERILEHKGDINVHTETWPKSTSLHLAAQNNHLELVKILLANKAQPEIDAEGSFPICVAAKKGYTRIFELFVEQTRVNVRFLIEQNEGELFRDAIRSENYSMVRWFLEHKISFVMLNFEPMNVALNLRNFKFMILFYNYDPLTPFQFKTLNNINFTFISADNILKFFECAFAHATNPKDLLSDLRILVEKQNKKQKNSVFEKVADALEQKEAHYLGLAKIQSTYIVKNSTDKRRIPFEIWDAEDFAEKLLPLRLSAKSLFARFMGLPSPILNLIGSFWFEQFTVHPTPINPRRVLSAFWTLPPDWQPPKQKPNYNDDNEKFVRRISFWRRLVFEEAKEESTSKSTSVLGLS